MAALLAEEGGNCGTKAKQGGNSGSNAQEGGNSGTKRGAAGGKKRKKGGNSGTKQKKSPSPPAEAAEAAEAEAEAAEAEAVEAGGCRKGCVWPAAWWGLHATQQAEKELRRAEDQHELAGGEMSREKGQAMGPDLCRTISTRCLPRGHLPRLPPPVGPPVEPVRLRGLGLRGTKRGAARIVLGPIDEGALNPVQQ